MLSIYLVDYFNRFLNVITDDVINCATFFPIVVYNYLFFILHIFIF